MMFSRKAVAEAAKELAAQLTVVDDVANLQKMQKEMADAIAKLNDRMKDMEGNIRASKAEVKFEAVKETQQMLNSVQGAFHDKLTDLTVRIARVENQIGSAPVIALPKSGA
jgi:predicted  nucleic acid-binding Zn-ribbon protein